MLYWKKSKENRNCRIRWLGTLITKNFTIYFLVLNIGIPSFASVFCVIICRVKIRQVFNFFQQMFPTSIGGEMNTNFIYFLEGVQTPAERS